MSIPVSWSRDSIVEALDMFDARGRAIITLASPRDAKLFRTAVYNFLRKTQRTAPPTLRLSGCDVIMEPRIVVSRKPLEIAAK